MGMKCTCTHTELKVHTGLKLSVNVYDPTRTLTLRNTFVRDMNRRFAIIKREIFQAIVTEDVFGLNEEDVTTFEKAPRIQINATPGPNAFQFGSSAQKVEEFMTWLRGRVDAEILQTTTLQQIGEASNQAWTNIYIQDSYKRGVQRARYEMQKAGYAIASIEESGGIGVSMSTPFHVDRLGLLYSRTFSELQGITAAMDTQISRVLTQGIADGDGPRLLARKLVSTIDGTGMGELGLTDTLGRFMPAQRRAQIMARTEIIRAHHQATIQEYKNWGVEGVVVKAEWSTAGDERVCAVCESLQGSVWTLAEIQNAIPQHPQCRCVALPYRKGDKASLTEKSEKKAVKKEKAKSKPPKEEMKRTESNISSFEKGIKTNTFETAGIFYKDELLFMRKGSKNKVGFNINDLGSLIGKDRKKITLTHNHPPQSAGGYGGSFSFNDIQTQLSYGWGKMRAIDTHFIYELQYSGEILSPKSISKLKSDFTRISNNNGRMLAAKSKGKVEFYNTYFSKTTHEIMEQFIKKYEKLGFKYTRKTI